MQYAKKLISLSIFSLALAGSVFIDSNLAQGAPQCGADGYNDPNDPACYTSYSYTAYGSKGGCWFNGGCDDSAFGIVPDLVPCYWLSYSCADGSTGSWCVNHPCGLECADSYEYTVTVYTCHYISSVKTWSVCANGVQVATDVIWSTKPYVAATCVNIPLTQTCGPDVDIKANNSDGPINIEYDTSATISWTSTDATECTVSNGILPDPDWTTLSGSQPSGNLIINSTYTQNCSGLGGTNSDSVSICVGPACNEEDSCTTPTNRCLSGTSTVVTEPAMPTSPDSPEGSFEWKCQKTCNGVAMEVSCSSKRSNPDIPVSSETGWSNCNLSCGGGNQTRVVSYHNCFKRTETQACNSHPCPPGYREVAPW